MMQSVPTLLAAELAKPPTQQRAFSWDRSKWLPKMHDLPDVQQMLDSLDDAVDRSRIRDVVMSELDQDHVLPAFVSTMVWGFGDAGYGPIRTRWMLTGINNNTALEAPVRDDVAHLLRRAVEIVRTEGPVAGYRHMNNAGRIKNLCGPFFTKWLYFTSAVTGPDDANAAPILDRRVRDWLAEHGGVSLSAYGTPDYERYLDLLRSWGSDYGRTPVQVEKTIFELATGRG